MIFFFPSGWKKSPKLKRKNNPGAPSTNTDKKKKEKKIVTEKDIVYVQVHILYTSVHPAAAACGGARQEVMGAGHV